MKKNEVMPAGFEVVNEAVEMAKPDGETVEMAKPDGETALVAKMDLNMLTNPENNMFCTIKADDHKSKVAIYNAITTPSKKMDDILNVPFNLKDIIAHPVEIVDEETGEVVTMLRTILIDDEGNSYAGVSLGVVSAIQRIFAIFGKPETWDEPLKVKLIKADTRSNNKVTTIQVL